MFMQLRGATTKKAFDCSVKQTFRLAPYVPLDGRRRVSKCPPVCCPLSRPSELGLYMETCLWQLRFHEHEPVKILLQAPGSQEYCLVLGIVACRHV